MRKLAFGLVAGIVLSGCSSPAPEPRAPFRAVADNLQLMEWIVDPAADVVWGSVGTIVDEKGTTELAPANDEEWNAVRNAAALIAESGNLLMLESRAADQDAWMQFASGLIDAGVLAMKAAEARDVDALFDAGGQIYNVCASCHRQYVDESVEGLPR